MTNKILAAILALCLCASFSSCGLDGTGAPVSDDTQTSDRDESENDDDGDADEEESPKDDKEFPKDDEESPNDDDGRSEETTRMKRSDRKKLEAETATVPPTEPPTERITIPVTESQTSGGAAVTEAETIIKGINKNTIKDDIIEMFGECDYVYSETSPRSSNEYEYYLGSVKEYGVDMPATMFFEFDDETGALLCYGYRIGEIPTTAGGKFTYPYSEEELNDAYDTIYMQLMEHFGQGTSSTVFAESGVLRHVDFDTEEGDIWFICGVDMWAIKKAQSYEKGVNEIILSCSP